MRRRERILTALNSGIPDRPPISFTQSDEHSLDGVLAHYGATSNDDLYAKAGIDAFTVWDWNTILAHYRYALPAREDRKEVDFWGSSYGAYIYPFDALDTIDALRAHRWPDANDFDYSHVYPQALEIKSKDMVVVAADARVGYQMHSMLRGPLKAPYDVTDSAYMGVYTDKILQFSLEYLDRLLTAGRGEIELVRADDDCGTMDRLQINPATWRRYFKPCWKAVLELVHKHNAKLWFHSCSCIRPILEDLVEIGVDVWNSLPPYVAGNDHVWLKEWRKGRLVLDGGVSHLVMVQGTPQEVADETQRVLDLFAPDGGLLIGPCQWFTANIPTENALAFFETALHYDKGR